MRKLASLISLLAVLSISANSYAKEKDPLIAGCMSCLIAGLGQVYNGEIMKGCMFFGGTLLGSMITLSAYQIELNGPTVDPGPFWTGIAISSATGILSIADAVIVANKINEGKAYL
ncbi:MAG: hypothetical protein WC614_09960 [bacterium]